MRLSEIWPRRLDVRPYRSRACAPVKMNRRSCNSWKKEFRLFSHNMHANINLMAVWADDILDNLPVDARYIFKGAPRHPLAGFVAQSGT